MAYMPVLGPLSSVTMMVPLIVLMVVKFCVHEPLAISPVALVTVKVPVVPLKSVSVVAFLHGVVWSAPVNEAPIV